MAKNTRASGRSKGYVQPDSFQMMAEGSAMAILAFVGLSFEVLNLMRSSIKLRNSCE